MNVYYYTRWIGNVTKIKLKTIVFVVSIQNSTILKWKCMLCLWTLWDVFELKENGWLCGIGNNIFWKPSHCVKKKINTYNIGTIQYTMSCTKRIYISRVYTTCRLCRGTANKWCERIILIFGTENETQWYIRKWYCSTEIYII